MLKLIDEEAQNVEYSSFTNKEISNLGFKRMDSMEGSSSEVAIKSFSKQLTEMRRSMVDNRKNISEMLTEINNFRHGMVESIENQKKQMTDIADQVVQGAQTNLLLQTGHLTLDLNMCKKRY